MQRKTRDVYKLKWRGEIIDTFPRNDRGGFSLGYAREMLTEYNLAYGGGVTLHRGREKLT